MPLAPTEGQTPGARWREEGERDPHGNRYNCDRAQLCLGHLTDDEIANAMYLEPTLQHLTAAKDRIRWLSRMLEEAAELGRARRHRPRTEELTDG